MSSIPLSALALVTSVFVLWRPCYAQGAQPDLKVLKTLYVQVRSNDTDRLRKLVADFARSHDFSRGEEATIPRKRKIFLMAGGFSTTFSANGGYYLVMHNLAGKNCVLIDLYTNGDKPSFKTLMANLQQTIEQAMPDVAKIVDRHACVSR